MTGWTVEDPIEPKRGMDEDTYAHLRSLLTIVDTEYQRKDGRAAHTSLGMSQAGCVCERQIRFRLDRYPALRHVDPLRSLVGTGTHLVMERLFGPLEPRFLAEQHVSYGPLIGVADLYDRFERAVVDWKTLTAAKLNRIRRGGPDPQHIVQVQCYGAGMSERGERPAWVSLVYLPTDGVLTDAYAYRVPFDRSVADCVVQRIEMIRVGNPVPKTPGRHCHYCPFYVPGSADGAGICSGGPTEGETNG